MDEYSEELKWTQARREALHAWRRDESRHIGRPAAAILSAVSNIERNSLVEISHHIKVRNDRRSYSAIPIGTAGGSAVSTVLMKPVGDACNLRCTYCYEGTGADRKKARYMSRQTLEAAISEALSLGDSPIQFLWHGGEPTLAGVSFFRHAVELQRKYGGADRIVLNGLQTNAVDLSDEWITFLRDNNFTVGVSVDGTQGIHDQGRPTADGRGTFVQVSHGIEKLQAASIPFGAICVVSSHLVGFEGEVLETFAKLGVRSFDVHPLCSVGAREARWLSRHEFYSFCTSLFDHWLECGSDAPSIHFFDDILKFMLGTRISTCYHAGKCSSIIGIESDGSVVPCTRPFVGTFTSFGNISTGLRSVIDGKTFKSFVVADRSAQTSRANCPWWDACHAGCPQQRVGVFGQDVAGSSVYCDCDNTRVPGFGAVCEHIARRVDSVISATHISSL